eukprot:jgi/Undpi1/13186/HiC_scaffold_8.g02848.m1
MWAAPSPHRLALLVQKLEAAGCPGGAFGGLEDRSKWYVRDLVSFVRRQQNSWSGSEDSDTDFGVALAVDAITTLQGKTSRRKAGKSKGEPIDSTPSTCPVSKSQEELRTLCQPVELIMEMPTATCRSLQDPGDEVNPIANDIARPAGDVEFPASLVVGSNDFTGFLAFVANARAEKTVKGPAVLKWMSAALGLHLQQWPP